MILLDTHVLVWLTEGSTRLGRKARAEIDAALVEGNLFVSAISFWEVAMLVDKQRLQMQINPETWRSQLLENGLQELAITGDIGITAALLKKFHGDPADRLITATAIRGGMHLCTADKVLLKWGLDIDCISASK